MQIIRGVAIGLLAGAAFFFFPFLLRIMLFFLLFGLIVRLIAGRGWRNRRNGRRYGNRYARRFGPGYDGDIISIDGRGFVPPVTGTGSKSNIPVA